LRRLGARSIPVLSRGDDWVFAQNIAQVVAFLGLDEKTGPVLSPTQLVERLDLFLDAGLRMIPQMPDDRLETLVPNRPRSYRTLAHHIFRIADAFVEVAHGAVMTQGLATAEPEEKLTTTAAIAAYGRDVKQRLDQWWAGKDDRAGDRAVETYYGEQRLHEVLERSTWHVGQHTRQWVMLLDMNGIAADRPLADSAFADLPMPKSVWDA
jgi:hypothetical protein